MAGDALTQVSSKVAALLDDVARHRDRVAPEWRWAAMRAARLERAAERRRLERRVGLIASLAVVLVGVALWYPRRSPTAMSFTVGAGGREGEGWVAAGADPVPIRFSEGSVIEVHAAAHARVISVNARGATVALERGTLTAAIVHRDRGAWTIAAGPFEVHVVGTRFDATWDPSSEVLTVALAEGHVEITGACLAAPRGVSTGETARLSCRESAPPLSPAAPPSASVAAIDASALVSPPVPSASVGSGGAVMAAPSWRELARRGEYAAAFAEADREGVDAIIERGPAEEVAELADVARLARHLDVATRGYTELRRRFPGSDGAAVAAFELGRMTSGTSPESATWFRTYLRERPDGAFEAEASGRLLEIAVADGDTERARAVAAAYVEKHPTGAHAALARSVLGP